MSTTEPVLGRRAAAPDAGIAAHGIGRLNPASRAAIAVVAGAAWGAATEWSVPHLPPALAPLANSAGPWIVLSLAMALMAVRLRESVALAVLGLLALVAGFYVAQDIRGWGLPLQQIALWSVASLVFGPLVGVAAHWLRGRAPLRAAVGAGALGGLFAGEALNGLITLRLWTPAAYWDVQLAIGLALVFGLPLWRARHRWQTGVPAAGASVIAAIAVGVLTFTAYHVSIF